MIFSNKQYKFWRYIFRNYKPKAISRHFSRSFRWYPLWSMLRSDIHVNYSSALQILPVSSCLANIPLCKVSTKTCANPTVGAANRDVRRIRVKQAGSGRQSVGAVRGRDRGALGALGVLNYFCYSLRLRSDGSRLLEAFPPRAIIAAIEKSVANEILCWCWCGWGWGWGCGWGWWSG